MIRLRNTSEPPTTSTFPGLSTGLWRPYFVNATLRVVRLVTPLAHLMRLLLQEVSIIVYVAMVTAPVVSILVSTFVVVAVLGFGAHQLILRS